MARRRLEDERFAYFAEASIVFLDLPDAVFRGYEGDEELLGSRAPTTTRRSSCFARRSPGSSRRRSTSRSGSAVTSTTSSAARSASACSRRAGAG